MSNYAPPWLQKCLRSFLVGGVAVSAFGVASAGPFDVARFPIQKQTAPASAGEVSVETPATPLRLNYQSAPWEKVLNDLAEQSQTTLVMKEAPPGRFSRRDGNQYSLSEAVRVLNHALEKEGYRVIHQQDYLILIKLEDVRTRYERSPVPRATGIASTKQTRNSTAPGVVYPRKFSTVTPVADAHTGQDTGVVPAQHTVPEDLPSTAGKVAPRSRRIVRSTIATKQPAVDVARLIHNSFGKESQLVSSGPNGLPSFMVSRKSPVDQSPVELAIGIDVNQNQLVVEGPEKATDEVKQTIQLIQASVDRGEETVRVVPSTVDVSNLAKSLQPSMNRLLAIRAQQEASEQQATQNNNPQGFPEEGNPLGAELRSDVTVQAMPGLGVLILSGNERDVEAVMAVINEIEKLSVGTAPAIQLLLLEHVDATQLSTLLSSVYEDLTSRQPGATTETPQDATDRSKVTFIPVTKPNALIILAPEADIPSILELARELDQPVDPLTEFEVFSLKSAIATQAAELVTNFFADRESLGGTLTAFADVRTNSLIVRARPRDLEEAAALILKIDRDASGAMNQLKVIPLKNAVASEVADVLNSAFQALQLPQGQNNQLGGAGAFNVGGTGESSTQLREIKSLAVEFLSTDGQSEELIRSGILADIRVTADPRINSLVVTAPARSMKLMEALIARLDQIPSSVAEIKVFTLRNSDATQAVDLLTSLFAQTTTGGGGGFNNATQQAAQGLQIAGATDVSNTLVSLRFSADVRTNSVVAVGGADSLNVVEAILLRLDEDDIRQRQTTVIRLKNTPAADVAEAVNQFLDSQRALAEAQPDLISNVELLEQEIVVVPEAVTNSLLVSATPRYFSIIQNMVARLDEAPPQVIIQALLVEVELQNDDEFGIELGLQDSILFDRSIMGGTLGPPGFQFNSVNLGNNLNGDPNTLGGQGLSNFGVGRTNNDLGFGGLVLSASSENISLLIRALAARRNVQVLSRPQIRALDNQEATIQVGQQVPVIRGGVANNFGGFTPEIDQEDVGLILTVRPRINPDGTIVMETAAIKSQLSGDGVPIFINPEDGSSVDSPIIDITSANTTVSVPNGHTIVLGGIITESDETIERKVPWLGDVPIVGRAFRFDATSSRRSELLVFLTPRVILNDADSEFIKQVETERTHVIEEQAEEIHGPLFGVPPTMEGMVPMNGPVPLPDGTFLDPSNLQREETGQQQSSSEKVIRQSSQIQQVSAEEAQGKSSRKRRVWPFR